MCSPFDIGGTLALVSYLRLGGNVLRSKWNVHRRRRHLAMRCQKQHFFPLSRSDSLRTVSRLRTERTHQSTDLIYRTNSNRYRDEPNETHKCDSVVLFMNWKIRLRLQKSISVGAFCFDANGQTEEQARILSAVAESTSAFRNNNTRSRFVSFFFSFSFSSHCILGSRCSSYLKIRWNNESASALTLHIFLFLFELSCAESI